MKEIFKGVFQEGPRLYTRNLVKGFKVHGEKLVQKEGIEYREWNPFQSKLGSAISLGIKEFPFAQGTKVLYLGAAHGVTPSFVSDIVGKKGEVYCIEIAPIAMRDLIRVCEQRDNMIPILADARHPEEYAEVGKVDVVFEDVADPQQAEILIENARFLAKGGFALIAIKSRAIDSVQKPTKVYQTIKEKLSGTFDTEQEIVLDKFEKDHLFLVLRKR